MAADSEHPAVTPDAEILFVLCVNNLGGGEMSMFAVARGLKKSGFDVTLAVYGMRPDLAILHNPGIPVIDLKTKRTLSLVAPLYRLLRGRRPPVLITALTHTNAICIITALLVRRGTRVIATEHSPVMFDPRTSGNWKDKLLCRGIGMVYRHAAEVVAVSKGLAAYIRGLMGGDCPVRVIYNPVLSRSDSTDAATHSWLTAQTSSIIMGAGRFSPEKNFALLVKAFGQLLQHRPARLVLLGEGEERANLEKLIDGLGLKDSVLLPGFVPNVRAWLAQAAVFVSPSYIEGFGNAIVEAMACGVPVVSTDCPFGPAEILDHGRLGRLVPVDDADAMRQAIEAALDQPSDKNAARRQAESYNETRCTDAYAALVTEVLQRPPASILRHMRQKIASIVMLENWMMGIVDRPIGNAPQWTTCPPVRWIGPRSQRRYLADPFAWPGKPQTLLCEQYDFAARIGTLREIELQGAKIVSDKPASFPGLTGHLSFPFMFAEEGETYAMPESSSARKLVIFKWANEGWREHATPLENVAAADSILFRHNGLYWIAYTDVDLGPFDNLNLAYAERLDGAWQKHNLNPVKCDRRSARCGGPVFTAHGKLYRPAQDCSQTYGGGIRIMEIIACTPDMFQEQEATLIMPEQGDNPDGFHTLTPYGDNACLVDGKRMAFSHRLVLGKVMRRFFSPPNR